MKKALLLGDYTNYTWHTLRGVDEQLVSILSDMEVQICTDYAHLTLEGLNDFDFVIDYIDGWNLTGNCDAAGALLAYVAAGGSILCIHNGIIKRSNPDLCQLYGATFTHHPAQEPLSYQVKTVHPMSKGIMPFEIDEEPYMFTLDNLLEHTIVLEYTYKGEKYPAAWLRKFGKGKMVYIAPGHNTSSFQNEGLRDLVHRAALYLTHEL